MNAKRPAGTSEARAGWFWPLIYTLALHLILFALLFVSFAVAPQIPSSRPLIQATVYQLQAQRPKSAANPEKITAEAEKTRAAQREAEQLEQQKRRAEAEQLREQKQAEAARQAEAQKQADLLKQAEQQARQVAEAARAQAEQTKRLEAEQKQREADAAKKRAAEAAQQKARREAAAKAEQAKRQQQLAEEKRKREAQALAKKQREATELAEKQKREAFEAEQARRKAEEARKAKARADLIAAEVERRRAQAESERKQLIASLDDLITRLVSEQWIRPVSARSGMSNEVQLSMLPDGTIVQVALMRSSGDTPFDNSTLAALRSIGRIPEIQQLDRASFDQLYRTRTLIFRPEELGIGP